MMHTATVDAAIPAVATRRRHPLNWGRFSLWLFCSLVFVYLVFPLLVVIPMSFSSVEYLVFPPPGWSLRWWERMVTSHFWIDGIVLSLKISVLTTILATLIGTLAALALVRGRFRGKEAMNVLILSPLIVPSIVVAVAVYVFYLDVGLVGKIPGYVLVYTCTVLPMVVLVIAAALVDFDESLERAAMNLGASRFRTYLSVTLPLIRPAVGSAALFAFKGAFDEVVIAIFIMGMSTPTLPAHMFYSVEQQGDLTIAAISSVMITVVITILATSAISQWARERKKALQRA
ncbi:MAG: ABC transporter permease [Chloroflexi bacterium]|nr:ABC transporter permease [Chloroflexota bacterium]